MLRFNFRIRVKRQEYQQGKILLAQMEAAEVQYTAVVKSLSDQRRELIANEAGSMRSSPGERAVRGVVGANSSRPTGSFR